MMVGLLRPSPMLQATSAQLLATRRGNNWLS